MTNEDINRLLLGRKIVDAYRSSADSYRDAVSTNNGINKKYQEREQAINKMHTELYNLGFGNKANNSAYDAFYNYNDSLCREEYFDCLFARRGRLCGECPTRACEVFFKKYKCVQAPLAPYADDLTFDDFLKVAKEMIYTFWQKKIPAICPANYGWIYGKKRNARFDLRWQPYLPLNLYWENYELQTKQEGGTLSEQWRKSTNNK